MPSRRPRGWRGLKQLAAGGRGLHLLSPPAWVAGIETRNSAEFDGNPSSPPAGVAWIETAYPPAPPAGRPGRRPRGWRGLKLPPRRDEFEFDGGYLEMCRERDRLREPIRKAVLNQILKRRRQRLK